MAFGFRGHRRVTGGQGIVQVNYTYDRAFDEVAAFPVSAKVGPREIAAYLPKIRRPVFHQCESLPARTLFRHGGFPAPSGSSLSLHLLPAAEAQLIEEADRRFGWKERNSRKLKELPGIESKQEAANRPKSFESMLSLADFRHALRSCAHQEEEEPAVASCISPGT